MDFTSGVLPTLPTSCMFLYVQWDLMSDAIASVGYKPLCHLANDIQSPSHWLLEVEITPLAHLLPRLRIRPRWTRSMFRS